MRLVKCIDTVKPIHMGSCMKVMPTYRDQRYELNRTLTITVIGREVLVGIRVAFSLRRGGNGQPGFRVFGVCQRLIQGIGKT